MIRVIGLSALALVFMGAAPQQPGQPSAERAKTVHLLQRTTFGVRPADIEAVTKLGRSKWLDQQLHPEKIDDKALAQRLEKFPTLAADMSEMVQRFQQAQQERRQFARQNPEMQNMSEERRQQMTDSARRAMVANLTPEQRQAMQRQNPQQILAELVSAKLTRAAYSERQLEEMMTDFWYNHFNVFFGKGLDRYMVADYEQHAIRPHVFGKFRDLLEATAKHPAMLFYLDNAQSVVPDTMRGATERQQLERFRAMNRRQQDEFLRRRGITREQLEERMQQVGQNRNRGLNENYARELMELHTLGVDGGYTQKDVMEVARAFTGWQFTRPGPRGGQDMEFVFRPQLHDSKEKTVLGRTLAAGRGMEDGEQVLDILARHPATAKFISRKLIERFVSDEPSNEFVNELAAVFTRTDGDLREVTRALFSSPRFYDAKVQRAKIKTPFELVASALRVTNSEIALTRATTQTLRTLGHLPYNEPAPTGFPASSEDWVNSGAMLNRMNFGLALAANRLDGVKVGDVGAEQGLPAMLQRLMPGVNTTRLETTIKTELAKPVEAPAQPDEQRMGARRNAANAPVRNKNARALGLALGSPDFQRK